MDRRPAPPGIPCLLCITRRRSSDARSRVRERGPASRNSGPLARGAQPNPSRVSSRAQHPGGAAGRHRGSTRRRPSSRFLVPATGSTLNLRPFLNSSLLRNSSSAPARGVASPDGSLKRASPVETVPGARASWRRCRPSAERSTPDRDALASRARQLGGFAAHHDLPVLSMPRIAQHTPF